MALPAEPPHHELRRNLANVLHTITASIFSILPTPKTTPYIPPSKISVPPFLFADSPLPLTPSPFVSTQHDPVSSKSTINGVSSAESCPGFSSTFRVSALTSNGKSGGPAFVGQVFTMCDLSVTGLMAVSTHFDIPFISKRTPQWLKKIFANITKSERKGPVFRFFMDLGDAVNYVKRLNIPSGVVGACRLDLAYERFKEKPHLFQFVPNEKQVKAANKLLKTIPQNGEWRKVDGVPVFGAQNLNSAVATTDGIKWYTPYFFDKNMLDNILEESVDKHFHALIQTRHMQRRRDVIDDNFAAEVIEEIGDSMWEPPEVQEVLDEVGHPAIPLSVISKAAEIQLLYAVDKVLLGNRWLRKATGIQPKFPYMVDSFERRSAVSVLSASESATCLSNSETDHGTSEIKSVDDLKTDNRQRQDFRFPWLKQGKLKQRSDARNGSPSNECRRQNLETNPFLPKITMVGISTADGQVSKSSLKKTMEDLTRELEKTDQVNSTGSDVNELEVEDRDPLFVANMSDHFSGLTKTGSAQRIRGGNN
ncbi:hypothetical protein like AT5G62650 [Hibiscus trionum]|uniref:Tic22-like family protein n=1 Tax=Hibiscus trionum TaxID=183268 RepID=A0A9W7JKM1_HIBTR|nr:hypothetical protein like AT5G62650 [Hibiscus trionum]